MSKEFIEKELEVAFQAVMSDIGKYYKVSDRLSDILSDSLSKHLDQSLQTAYNKGRSEGIGEAKTLMAVDMSVIERMHALDKITNHEK